MPSDEILNKIQLVKRLKKNQKNNDQILYKNQIKPNNREKLKKK